MILIAIAVMAILRRRRSAAKNTLHRELAGYHPRVNFHILVFESIGKYALIALILRNRLIYTLAHIYGFAYIYAMNLQPGQVFHLLSDETRLRSLLLMQQEGELCVCELTHALGMIQPKISRHLAALRDAGLVLDRRQGQWIYYRIHPELPGWVNEVIMATTAGIAQQPPFSRDRETLATMPNRPNAPCCA